MDNVARFDDTKVLIRCGELSRTFSTPVGPFRALCNVDLEVERGEFLAVVGRSGSGKSTLLNLLAGIDRPSSGELRVGETVLSDLSERALTQWRANSVGVVFQFFQLLPTLTVLENTMLPMDFAGRGSYRERREWAMEQLQRVGIADQANKFPGTLSGGEQQRSAIARALANDPPLIVADEPTGNLDSATADEILALFAHLVSCGRTVVMVTHEPDIRRHATRMVTLADGRIVEELQASAHRSAS